MAPSHSVTVAHIKQKNFITDVHGLLHDNYDIINLIKKFPVVSKCSPSIELGSSSPAKRSKMWGKYIGREIFFFGKIFMF